MRPNYQHARAIARLGTFTRSRTHNNRFVFIVTVQFVFYCSFYFSRIEYRYGWAWTEDENK